MRLATWVLFIMEHEARDGFVSTHLSVSLGSQAGYVQSSVGQKRTPVLES